jgi:hypothetical protein
MMTQHSEQRTKASSGKRPVEAAPDPDPEQREPAGERPGGEHVCTVAFCPIGLALTAAERVQPDVVSHLLVAGREFFLAAKAVMDARADDLGGDGPPQGPPRMEHIDIG